MAHRESKNQTAPRAAGRRRQPSVTLAVEATGAIFRSSPLAIVAVDRDGLISAWSPAAEHVLGWTAGEVVGRPATILRPDDPAWISRGFAEVMAGETLVAVPVRYPHRDGRPRDLELFVAPLRDETGGVRGAVVVAEDVTAIHEAQSDRARLATAIDQAAEAIVVTDPDGRIVYANPAFERVTGYPRAELLGRNPRVLQSGAHDAAFYAGMWATLLAGRTWRGLLVNRRKDGSVFEEEAAISPVRDQAGVTTAYVAVKRDLSTERALEAELRAEVVDRVAVRDAISAIRVGETPEETAASVIEALGSVDGIEYPSVFHLPVHDTRAHRLAGRMPGRAVVPGEVVDAPIAAYVRERAPAGAWLHVFATEPPPGANAAAIVHAAGLTGGVYAPVVVDGRPVAVIGGLTTRPDASDVLGRRLRWLLEIAAHVAPTLGRQLVARDDVEGRRAIMEIVRGRRFHPVFQPIVRLADRGVIGYEALTRFDDGVPPNVRFAEAAALGVGLGLESACLRAAVAAAKDLSSGAWLTLNASAAFLLSGRLEAILGGVDRPIVVEITEYLAVDDYGTLRTSVEALGPGVHLAVDDVGADFAGLRHLVELRPHVVKLDRGIVRGIDGDPARQSLVAGMVHYIRLTDGHLVAEGVETARSERVLTALGVKLARDTCSRGRRRSSGSPRTATPPDAGSRAPGAAGARDAPSGSRSYPCRVISPAADDASVRRPARAAARRRRPRGDLHERRDVAGRRALAGGTRTARPLPSFPGSPPGGPAPRSPRRDLAAGLPRPLDPGPRPPARRADCRRARRGRGGCRGGRALAEAARRGRRSAGGGRHGRGPGGDRLGTYEPVLAAFAARLAGGPAGPVLGLGTPLEMKGGRTTGRLAGPVGTGSRKANRVTALAAGAEVRAAYGTPSRTCPCSTSPSRRSRSRRIVTSAAWRAPGAGGSSTILRRCPVTARPSCGAPSSLSPSRRSSCPPSRQSREPPGGRRPPGRSSRSRVDRHGASPTGADPGPTGPGRHPPRTARTGSWPSPSTTAGAPARSGRSTGSWCANGCPPRSS